jgi:hypothetical protein
MFHLNQLLPYEGEIKTVKLDFDPIRSGRLFGTITDLEGNKYDLQGCCGGHLMMRPYVDDYFTSTLPPGSWRGVQSAQWVPYKYEVVAE